jgi:hypothetical protein
LRAGGSFRHGQRLVEAGEDFGELEVGEELEAEGAVEGVGVCRALPFVCRTECIEVVRRAGGQEDGSVADRQLAGHDLAPGFVPGPQLDVVLVVRLIRDLPLQQAGRLLGQVTLGFVAVGDRTDDLCQGR